MNSYFNFFLNLKTNFSYESLNLNFVEYNNFNFEIVILE